jgi:two-component system nitrogen regulation sensor histidine kinase NtrY
VNLFTNSITALQQDGKGKISVSCRYAKEMKTIRIEIADNGCGIPAKLRERVLEPYFSTKDQGTGLGLAIVNQIVIDHQGYLRIGENAPRGTRISIELPV